MKDLWNFIQTSNFEVITLAILQLFTRATSKYSAGVEAECRKQRSDVMLISEPLILQENVEIRRVLIERYGSQQFMLDTGAEIRQHDKFGSLYVKEVWGDEPIVMVHITNSTAEPDGQFRSYFLRVPPTIRTAREAVAWTFGMTADEYDPLIET